MLKTQQVLNKLWLLLLLLSLLLLSQIQKVACITKYILANRFREPLSEAEDHPGCFGHGVKVTYAVRQKSMFASQKGQRRTVTGSSFRDFRHEVDSWRNTEIYPGRPIHSPLVPRVTFIFQSEMCYDRLFQNLAQLWVLSY